MATQDDQRAQQDARARAQAEQARDDATKQANDKAQAKADAKFAQGVRDAATGVAAAVGSLAQSAQASTGEVEHVPDSPEAIAKQGTKLGTDGDVTTGGSVDVGVARSDDAPKFVRVWGMDNDHTTDNRAGFDPLKPDMSVEV